MQINKSSIRNRRFVLFYRGEIEREREREKEREVEILLFIFDLSRQRIRVALEYAYNIRKRKNKYILLFYLKSIRCYTIHKKKSFGILN